MYIMINNTSYFKYILLIIILVILFSLFYKKILMYFLFNDFFTRPNIFEFINVLINMAGTGVEVKRNKKEARGRN